MNDEVPYPYPLLSDTEILEFLIPVIIWNDPNDGMLRKISMEAAHIFQQICSQVVGEDKRYSDIRYLLSYAVGHYNDCKLHREQELINAAAAERDGGVTIQ